jgi:hypothetical protein
MNFADRPQPWCLICLQSDLQHRVLTRFQRRYDAEAHLKILRQMAPHASYTLMFDSSVAADADLDSHWQHS